MEKSGIQVLNRAFDIVEELAHSRKPLSLNEITNRTGLSKTTVHRILQTLLERAYVEKTLDGYYAIGPKLFHTLSYHINSLELQAEAKPHLATLQKALELTVYLGVLDGSFVTIIEREASDRSDEVFTHVGHRDPAHCSSMGKCLLSCLSLDELEEVLYDSKFEAFTPRTITHKKEFIEHLHQVRKQGWAIDNEESRLDHRCIAAPIFNYRGDAVAVVGISGTNAELPDECIESFAQQVVLAGQRISNSLGYVE